MNKTITIIWLGIILVGFTAYAQEEAEKIEKLTEKPAVIEKDFPLAGHWQIISYQVIGYPKINRAEIKTWMNRVIKFNTETAIMYEKSTMKVCSISEIQVTQKDAEGYFLIGYEVKPHRLGVFNKEIKVTKLICTAESWFGQTQEFVNLSDEQMLIYWDGVLFYLIKMPSSQEMTSQVIEKLFVMPQSVGTLMPDTVFSEKMFMTAFPNYQVEEITHDPGGKKQVFSHFEVYQKNQKETSKLVIYPDLNTMTINQIRIFDKQAVMPGEIQLGDTHQDIFNNVTEFIDCQAGVKERQGQTTCSFKNMSMIQYVFEPINIIDGQLVSPIEALNRAKLVEVVWKADNSLITGEPRQSSPTEAKPALSPTGTTEKADTQVAATTVLLEVKSAYKIQEKQLNEVSHQLTTLLEKQAPKSAKTTTPSDEANTSSQTMTKADSSHLLTVFQTAQTAWIQYRNNNCRLHSTLVANKSEKANKTFSCLEKITMERIKEIEAIFKDLAAKTNGG